MIKAPFQFLVRTRILLLVFIAALPPLLLVAFNGWQARQEAISDANRTLLSVSSSLAAIQIERVNAARQLLETLALTPVIQDSDPEGALQLLTEVLARNPGFSNILAAYPNGDVYATGLGKFTVNSADRLHVRRALTTGRFSSGEYIVSRTSRKPGLPFAYPVRSPRGELLGVLMVTVDLEQYRRVFDEAGLPEGSVLGMTDHEGLRLFIYRHSDTASMIGQHMLKTNFAVAATSDPSKVYTLHGADGVERVFSFRKLRLDQEDKPYMYLFVGVPQHKILGDVTSQFWRDMAFGVVAMLLTLAAARWLGRVMIEHPLNELQQFAGRIRNGKFDARCALVSGHDEFAGLAESFNTMAEALANLFKSNEEAHEALALNERKLRAVADYTYDWEYWTGVTGAIIWMSPACERVTGYAPSDFTVDPELVHRIIHPDDRAAFARHVQEVAQGNETPHALDFRVITREGATVWISHSCVGIRDEHGHELGRRVCNRDITQRKEAENELRLGARIFEDTIQGVVVTDTSGRMLRINPSFTAITGYAREDVEGLTPRILKSGRHQEDFYEGMWRSVLENGHWAGEIWNRRKNGEIYPEWLAITSLRNEQGLVTHYVGIFHDITEVKSHQLALKHQAEHDALTGLPNRQLLHDRLGVAIRSARRHGGRLAVIFVDLDHFKTVNDSLGHATGDLLLQEMARRISGALREGDSVARLGGDEFVVLLTDIRDNNDAAHVAERILTSLREPFKLGQVNFSATGSMGIAVYPNDGREADDLMKNADLAMYKAKQLGRNMFQFFGPDMEVNAKARLKLEARLQQAVRGREIEIHLQPLVDLRTMRVEGAEALARWTQDGQPVWPAEFIPLAEETGLIVPLGEMVLTQACRQAQAIRNGLFPDFYVSVNVSARQLDQDLAELIDRTLIASGLPAASLRLEIAESVLLTSLSAVEAQLERLRKRGISCQLDDFGTGCSALSHLKKLPLDGLKIDRTFVADLETSADSKAIIAAIVSVGKAMNLRLTAEGVESAGQLRILRELGVDAAQGFLFAHPMPPEEFQRFLEKGLPAV